MSLFFLIFLIFILLLAGLIFYSNGGSLSLDGADFLAKGREVGLSTKEIKTLKKAADVLGLTRPLTLLGSLDHVDNAIKSINHKLEVNGFEDPELLNVLEDLYSYRRKVEINKHDKKNSIRSSREIELNQKVKVTVSRSQKPFIGYVTDNCTDNLTVDFSKDNCFTTGSGYDGSVNVYFWKNEDAGYHFESTICDNTLGSRWKISHSTELIRSQKRQEVRVDLDIPGYIYQIEDISKRNSRPEGFNGTIIQLNNLSEGGTAFLIHGRIVKGLPIKLEFQLIEKLVVVCGIVRFSEYNRLNNCSLVRIKFIEPLSEMLAIIRSFIYNINDERDQLLENKTFNANINESNKEDDTLDGTSYDPEGVDEVEYLPDEVEIFN